MVICECKEVIMKSINESGNVYVRSRNRTENLRGKMKQTQRLKLGHSRFNLFFKVMKSRKGFGRVRERVPEAGGRRDK